jgi:predicted SnoaL-like aldol condensation-catalyzing enzyme
MRLFAVAVMGLVLVAAPATPDNRRAKEAREAVDGWMSAVNAGKGLEAIDHFFVPEYVWHIPGEDIRGREAFREIFRKFSQNCPAVRVTPLEIVTDRDLVSVRWAGRCTSDPASALASMSMDRFAKGKFVEGWEISTVTKGWLVPEQTK